MTTDWRDLSLIISSGTTSVAGLDTIHDIDLAATPPGIPQLTDAWGAALGIVGLLMALVASKLSSVADAVVSLAFYAASIIADAVAVANPAPELHNLLENIIVLFADVAAGGLDLEAFGVIGGLF